jgi:hypothetical protein
MEQRSRLIPPHVAHFRERDIQHTHATFFKYRMDEDVVLTLDDGSEIITSPMKAAEIMARLEDA